MLKAIMLSSIRTAHDLILSNLHRDFLEPFEKDFLDTIFPAKDQENVDNTTFMTAFTLTITDIERLLRRSLYGNPVKE
jgi:hypothetical protein